MTQDEASQHEAFNYVHRIVALDESVFFLSGNLLGDESSPGGDPLKVI